MRLVKRSRVRFWHTDPARIVYYPRFFEWFHDIFEASFEEASGIPYADILNRLRIGFPVVQLATEFRRPVFFGDVVDLEIFLSRMSDRSATFEYRVRKDGVLHATASIKVAAMHMDTAQPATIPEDIRAAFASWIETDDERPNPERIR